MNIYNMNQNTLCCPHCGNEMGKHYSPLGFWHFVCHGCNIRYTEEDLGAVFGVFMKISKPQRILTIDKCDDCPFFDNQYHDFAETCTKLDRNIERAETPEEEGPMPSFTHPIPADCPLPTPEEK